MMVPYLVYTEDGEILRTGNCQLSDLVLQANEPGELVMQCDAAIQDDTHCVIDFELVELQDYPAISFADPVSLEATINGILPGTKAHWPDGAVTLEDDGTLTLEAFPGDYVITLKHPHYKPYEVQLNVPA